MWHSKLKITFTARITIYYHQGYDLVTLASPTRSVIGVELSETAAGVAREVK